MLFALIINVKIVTFASELHKSMIGGLIKKVFGDKHSKDIKKLQPRISKINEYFASYKSLSNDELRAKTNEFQERIHAHLSSIDNTLEELTIKASQEELSLDEKDELYNLIDEKKKERDQELEQALDLIVEEAFAVVKETARRFSEADQLEATATELDIELATSKNHITIKDGKAIYNTSWEAAGNLIEWNMVHYDVQLIGGLVLHSGKIAEMATGEGKTLVATLPAYTNALAKQGVHVVTVNDYLAQRDAEWMAPIMQFLGLTVDCIDKYEANSQERRSAYLSDITYGTNSGFGFDYLRDNMVRNEKELVQHKHHYAMIDEVDSVLIDEARTPLIISGPVPKGDQQEQYALLKPRIQTLFEQQKKLATQFLVQAKEEINNGNINHESGGLALLRTFRSLPKSKALIKYLSEQGKRSILQKTENYYLQEQEKNMPLVDEELYFVIDEKKNTVELTDKGIEYLSRQDNNKDFFVLPILGEELEKIENSSHPDEEKAQLKDDLLSEYATKAERLHAVSQLLKAYALFERDDDYIVEEGQVKIVDEQLGRTMEGRRYSDGLHQALEAKENVKIEAATQTYASITLQNYFRMYHKLSGMTGTAETEARELWDIYKLEVTTIPTNKPIIRKDEEDKLYKTAKEKYSAVIEEIIELKEQGRPVLVGTSSVESSELVSRLLTMRKIPHNVLNAKQHQRESEIVAEAGQAGNITIATNMAGRGTDIKLGKGVIDAGGLAIVATERHDSRRVDRQLRGRAGRQGDPGSSQFFLSLEDNLMRRFGSDRTAKIMDRIGYEEGEPLQHRIITNSVSNAQKKVEENNFGIRKRLLEFDDVMNNQRTVIYKRRRNALKGQRLSFDLANIMYDLVNNLVYSHHPNTAFDSFKIEAIRTLVTEVPFSEQDWKSKSTQELTEELFQAFVTSYEAKKERTKQSALPIIKQIRKNRGDSIKRVAIPYSDGNKIIQSLVDIDDVLEDDGESIVKEFEKTIVLAFMDNNWKEHLRLMDELRQSVQLATYEQKDPLLIYKFEAFELFKSMLQENNKEIGSFLMRAELPELNQNVQEAREQKTDMSRMKTNEDAEGAQPDAYKGAQSGDRPSQVKQMPVSVAPKVGRNDLCPCGSGKKYKKCHGRA